MEVSVMAAWNVVVCLAMALCIGYMAAGIEERHKDMSTFKKALILIALIAIVAIGFKK